MRKILAIDDTHFNIELLNQIIRRFYPDYKFLFAHAGLEGIELANKEKPDLILLDILMPGINGFEVCKRLKKAAKTKHIPIIMVSALGQDAIERTKGLNAGADAFISKPYNQTELRAQINVALRIKKVEDLLRKRNEILEFDIKDQSLKHLQTQERFFQIAEHAREFYWETDAKGLFTYVSPVVEQTLHVSPLDIIGKATLKSLFELKDEHILQKAAFSDFEVELEANNKKLWLSISGFSILSEDKEFKGKRGVCYDITRRKKAEIKLKDNLQQIEKYQSKLKKLNTEITLIEERERRRIAENLHDSLGQTLSLAYLNLSSIMEVECPEKIRNTIEGISKLLSKGIKESRELTYDLSPPILYELGLIPAIKWKIEQVEKNNDIETRFVAREEAVLLKKENNIFVYRIVCELLANIIKHAKASNVGVEVSVKDKFLRIIVEDNGVGFDKNKISTPNEYGGFGLMSIIERLDNIHGSLQINSAPNSGTKVVISVPTLEAQT